MRTETQIKIIIADDHSIFMEGITALISNDKISIIANCKNGQEVLDILKNTKVDLVISDINMPVMDGITLTSKLKKLYPEIKIIILSMYEEKYIIKKAIAAGADGYMSKNLGKEEILKAIASCIKGEKYISKSTTKFMQHITKTTHNKLTNIPLTNREKQILQLIIKEMENSEIAIRLDISKRTVETHKKNMMLKLGAKNTVGLIKIALKNKYFDN